jgi:hypothetical protein
MSTRRSLPSNCGSTCCGGVGSSYHTNGLSLDTGERVIRPLTPIDARLVFRWKISDIIVSSHLIARGRAVDGGRVQPTLVRECGRPDERCVGARRAVHELVNESKVGGVRVA